MVEVYQSNSCSKICNTYNIFLAKKMRVEWKWKVRIFLTFSLEMRIWKTHSRPNEICKFSIVQLSTLMFFQHAFLCLEIHENALVNGYQNTANLYCAHDENRETVQFFS